MATDRAKHCSLRQACLEAGARRTGTLYEKRHRLADQNLVLRSTWRGQPQGRYAEFLLTVNAQANATCREHLDAGGGSQECADKTRDTEDLLKIVEHEQYVSPPQVVNQNGINCLSSARLAQPELRCDGRRDKRRVTDSRETHETSRCARGAGKCCGGCERKARLARTAGAR